MSTPESRAPEARLKQFASDNWAGICPEAWNALERANSGHAPAYGQDEYTTRACDLIREFFEIDCEVFFTFNGTAANSLAIASLCRSYHSVICHRSAHIETDECGAPEFFSHGAKLLHEPGENGKVLPGAVRECVHRRSDIHYPKPRVLSISQPTELGTVYTPAELKDLWAAARDCGLHIHMDGARFGNALATLDCPPRELTWEAGVDVLCLGGSKAGLPVGDAVVFFDTALAEEFEYRCKQAGQLASKMRFLSAPWIGMLEEGAYLRRASEANARAAELEARLREIPGVTIKYPREANAVFADMPPQVARALHDQGWSFYSFIGDAGARLMCSWDTTPEDVDALASAIASLCDGRVSPKSS